MQSAVVYRSLMQRRKWRETMQDQKLSAAEALAKLKEGNKRYLSASSNPGDVSPQIRQYTCENGQSPYATVITCSESRVIP